MKQASLLHLTLAIMFVLHFSTLTKAQLQTFTCFMKKSPQYGTECLISNQILHPDQTEFEINVPPAIDVSEVRTFTIMNSVIPVLNLTRVCQKIKRFPGIIVRILNNDIKEVTVDALSACNIGVLFIQNNKNLTTLPAGLFKDTQPQMLYLTNNSLLELPENLFTSEIGWKWVLIDLEGNKLKQLPKNLFEEYTYPWIVNLANNRFQEFPYDALYPIRNSLIDLRVDSNDIASIDLDKILETFSYLRRFSFNDNLLKCEEHLDLLATINAFHPNLKVQHRSLLKRRYFKVEEINMGAEGTVRCIGDVEWAAVHYVRSVEKNSTDRD